MPRASIPLFALFAAWGAGCAPEGPTAFITFNIPPDSACVFSPSADKFIPQGLYDISEGGAPGSTRCASSYFVNLLVNSYLRSNQDMDLGRAEPNVLQLHSAEVRLTTVDKRTIVFSAADPPLPNPFLVTTANSLFPSEGMEPSTGIASIEAIPVAYAPFLTDFIDGKIQAEIQIFGRTTGDVDIELAPFVYPIEICDGCLTMCLKAITAPESGLTLEDVIGPDCDDNAGADGRVCIDIDC